ncbi:MAG: hypothetical protein V3V18_15155 [Methylococcales bacterium]
MNLLPINTSLLAEIKYQGKTISTGIVKKGIEGSIFVAKNNLKVIFKLI